MSSSVHIGNKKKYILILGESPTQGLDGTTLTTERKYSADVIVNRQKIGLSLYYNGATNF